MHTDVAFRIGASHKVCQDYARSGANYIILSDGCSSSPDTDIGARLLVKATEEEIKAKTSRTMAFENAYIFIAVTNASNQADNIGLDTLSVDATLLTVLASESRFIIKAMGDGCVFIKHANGFSDLFEIAFPSNYPLYPSYFVSVSETERLTLIQQVYKESGNFRTITQTTTSPSGDVTSETIKEQYSDAVNEVWQHICDEKDVEFIALMSDGVCSFLDENRNPIPAREIVSSLCSFKTSTGEAAQRRLSAFLKDAEKRKISHFDDVSLAVIFMDGQ